jgi:hypothetical protein
MQTGLMEHDKQEAAGRFLLEAVSLQPDAYCTTDLNSKKISRIVNRHDPVPDDIRQASLKPDIIQGVYTYFSDEVEMDMNPVLKFDVLERLCRVKGDGGSGAQFRGLITFDLANMEVSNVPFVVHDSDLLDPIEKPALTEIIKEYDAVKKTTGVCFF